MNVFKAVQWFQKDGLVNRKTYYTKVYLVKLRKCSEPKYLSVLLNKMINLKVN